MYGVYLLTAYTHENGIVVGDGLYEEMDDTPERAYTHENGTDTLDGTSQSMLLSGLALLASSP